jgi:preflagellin peptidase FlaK
VLGAAIAFAIGYGMWVTGGWAGGDIKLFTALGALLPMFFPSHAPFPYSSSYPLFPITILFNSAFVALPALVVQAAICRLRGKGVLYERVKITNLKAQASSWRCFMETFTGGWCSGSGSGVNL